MHIFSVEDAISIKFSQKIRRIQCNEIVEMNDKFYGAINLNALGGPTNKTTDFLIHFN